MKFEINVQEMSVLEKQNVRNALLAIAKGFDVNHGHIHPDENYDDIAEFMEKTADKAHGYRYTNYGEGGRIDILYGGYTQTCVDYTYEDLMATAACFVFRLYGDSRTRRVYLRRT